MSKLWRIQEDKVSLILDPQSFQPGDKLQLQTVGGQRTFYADKPSKVPMRLVPTFLRTGLVVRYDELPEGRL